MNLQVFVIVLASGSVQLPDANLAQITVALLYLLAFSVPSRTISKPYNIVYFLAFNRLLVTEVTLIMDLPAIFT